MGREHLNTPKKVAIRETLLHPGEDEFKSDICRKFNISRSTGNRILREAEDRNCRTFHNIPGVRETRGRKKKLSDDDVQKLVQWIRTNKWKPDGRKPGYAVLPAAAGVDVECSGGTVRRALKSSKKLSAHFFHAGVLARKHTTLMDLPVCKLCWRQADLEPRS